MTTRSTIGCCPPPLPCLLLILLFVVGLTGCTPATTTTVVPPNNEPTQELPVTGGPTVQPPALPSEQALNGVPGKVIAEYWERNAMRGSRIGHSHYIIEEVPVDDAVEPPGAATLIRTISRGETVVERAGQTSKQQIILRSWDTPQGQLVRFESELITANDKMITRGQVAPGNTELRLETESTGKTSQSVIPWKPEYRGFFGVEQSLRAKPLQPNEERTVYTLLPILNQVAENRLQATNKEAVSLPAGAMQLLKINGSTLLAVGGQQQRIDTTLWIDDAGEALKSYMPGLQQETLRTTRTAALAADQDRPPLDLIVDSVVKVNPPLENPLTTKRVLYRAKVKEGSLAGIFANGLSQRVRMIDDQTAEIEVLAVNLNTELPADLKITPPVPADSAANNLIQADDRLVAKLAMNSRRPADDAYGIALDLEKLVNRAITKKNFSQAFASAAEVARTMEGDCTEHAVLLAAVCRARKVPARTAIGLVYYPPEQGFAYHMWDEVWTGDRWVPLDATLGRGQVAADRIKLLDTNLDGEGAYAALLPVVQVFGRLQLEILEVE